MYYIHIEIVSLILSAGSISCVYYICMNEYFEFGLHCTLPMRKLHAYYVYFTLTH